MKRLFVASLLLFNMSTTPLKASEKSFIEKHCISLLCSACIYGLTLALCQQYIKLFTTATNAETANPNLYDLFNKIKTDAGIINTIHLYTFPTDSYIAQNELNETSAGFFARITPNTIFISEELVQTSPSEIITWILRHELEHYKQYHRYPGTHNPFWSKSQTLEHEADKAAAKYIKCDECLERVSCDWLSDQPNEIGYFSKQDLKPYIDNAKLSNNRCNHHPKTITVKTCWNEISINWDNIIKNYHHLNHFN